MTLSTVTAEKIAAPESVARGGARGPRAEQRRLSRQRLIDAARELCAEGRFLSCAVSDIADRAELSRAAFYLHFKGKEDLLAAVLAGQFDWYVRQHEKMSPKLASTTAGIVGWLKHFVTGFRDARELLMQVSTATATSTLLNQQQTNRLKGIGALGQRVPALRMFRPDGSLDADRHRRVLLFVYELEQACMNIAYNDDAEDAASILQLVAEDFERLLGNN